MNVLPAYRMDNIANILVCFLWRSENSLDSFAGAELQMFVSHQVDSGDIIQVLYKSTKYSLLLSCVGSLILLRFWCVWW